MVRVRVATYNIHKGVQGYGLRKRLEIHNLGHAVEQFDADIVCLQEVRGINRREAQRFTQWPALPQAEFLAPQGYASVYRTNATTQHGDHGNAVLSRWPVAGHQHEDMSDHRFEQRGLLHAEVVVEGVNIHVIVVHLGLIRSSRVRQLAQLVAYIHREIAAEAPVVVAGDFNDWSTLAGKALADTGLRTFDQAQVPTFPSRMPLVQLDHMYARGLTPLSCHVPQGRIWGRMSDHLPLIGEFEMV